MKGCTLREFAQALGCGGSFEEKIISGFETDSRNISAGKIFVALKGERVDGHNFIQQAAANKALAAVVSEEYKGEGFGLPLLRVPEVIPALQKLAKTILAKQKGRVIAVTGSVGKTTTKEFISTLLEGKFRVAKTPGNANSQVGIPLSVLNWEGEADVYVFEMAMSEPGQIKKLVDIAPPDIGVITKIGVSHAEFFKDGIEGIAAAKAEIFSHPKTQIAIINGASSHFKAFAELTGKKILFGSGGNYDYMISGMSLPVPFQASHLLDNFCAAVAVARTLGMSWDEIKAQVPLLKTYKRRFERIEKDGLIFINDSYNASPESNQAALSNLPSPAEGKKTIAVLGEMKELGAYSENGHRLVAEFAAPRIDHLLCFGPGCKPMVEVFTQKNKPVELYEDYEVLRSRLFQLAEAGDVILLKGANSKALWRLVEDS